MFRLFTRCTWKFVHYFYEPPLFFSMLSVRIFCASRFFGALEHSHLCVLEGWRGGGREVRESPGVSTPKRLGTGCAQINRRRLWIYTATSVNACLKQPQQPPQPPQRRGRGGRTSQSFSSPWGWVILHLGTPEPAPGGYRRSGCRLDSPAEEASTLVLAFLISCMTVGVHG